MIVLKYVSDPLFAIASVVRTQLSRPTVYDVSFVTGKKLFKNNIFKTL